MIEKFLNNELSIKRWRRFKSHRLAVVSSLLLIAACFFSFTAEFWANNKPIVMKFGNNYYYPILKDYTPQAFGLKNQITVDYKKLPLADGDWAVFPMIVWDPYESNKEVRSYPSPPTLKNIMGTDDRGRDIFTRLLYGLRYSVIYAVLVWALSFFVGTVLGGLMGFYGSKVDFYGQRITEILSTVPQLLLLIILISIFKPSMALLVFISSLFGWIGISYYVRGEFLKNRRMEFVEAARAVGAGSARIFFKHILPNSLTPIITFTPFVIAGNITGLASLDYLGFGLTPPTPSWGELLSQAQKHFSIGWWLALYPSLALFMSLTLLSLIGEGVRDAINPRE
ncbi:MAG: ABC transporter permease subunit [Bacteriovoracaceae bacterium]|nr:ABC transporter permease subunit [Bacteriovoracaceae bacterium]